MCVKLFQVSLADLIVGNDAVFYISHKTIVTKWLIDDSDIAWETDIGGLENGKLQSWSVYCRLRWRNGECYVFVTVCVYV